MKSSVVDPEELFSKYPIIQRESFAQHLTQFLNTKADDGYVLNLNAEWGAGKTTFLKCWYNMLKEDHPVVYFDAWKSDFTHDAMLALLDTFHDQLMSPLTANKELTQKLLEKGSHFVKTAIPSLLVGYLKHKTGVPQNESLLGEVSEHFGLDFAEKELGDAIKETMKAMLEQRNKVEGIKEFQNTLVELSKKYLDVFNTKKAPIYVLIDELDRCRPNYAIEVIECVKHFFDTKDFVFVLSTDTEQLQHSIKAVYGEGFDSHSYLSRFFDRTVTIPTPTLREYSQSVLNSYLNFEHVPDEIPDIGELFEKIFAWHDINSIREIKKIFSDLDVAKSINMRFEILPLLLLSILKRNHLHHFKKFKKSNTCPYLRNRSSNYEENIRHVTNSSNINKFKLTSSSSVSFDEVIYCIAQCINRPSVESYSNYWGVNLSDSFGSSKIIDVVKALSSDLSINRALPEASREDYFNLIDLVGHFE
ncbi:P-loop NTPase fold protein [Photobacterium sp. 1_MG-2023]|uniref:KAP family P-loop NTPase fold protein n=1 Tax=Photobacterium sp. 1_MG-2023 TaxID=3062646 RepID=UPI0026E322CE|nr:P-loop NTPase fold protein [Photobacterium sp. 1_MG-2023]MDO6706173.1 P-loop NTPase fold protein [Photobacterium sp. 1_MG-2023]